MKIVVLRSFKMVVLGLQTQQNSHGSNSPIHMTKTIGTTARAGEELGDKAKNSTIQPSLTCMIQ